MKWTDEQAEAIRLADRSLLVSAGAGSGKTAVLAERCAALVADGERPCEVGELLVVTFTEAAAAEMRDRIGRALRGRLEQRPHDMRLRRQIALLDTASISTIHAFCRRLLTRFFADVGLDPAFTVLDECDAAMLRRDALDAVFDDWNRRDNVSVERLDALIAEPGRGREDAIRNVIEQLAAFLESTVDPDEWLNRAAARYMGTSPSSLAAEWAAERTGLLLDELDRQCEAADRADRVLRQFGPGQADAFLGVLEAFRAAARRWRDCLATIGDGASTDDVCAEMAAFEFAALPRRSKKLESLPASERAAFEAGKSELEAIRTRFTEKLKKGLARFSAANWAQGIAATAPHVATLIELCRDFRRRYAAAKRAQTGVDFADLERYTLHLLRDARDPQRRTPVADWLARRYAHVLVDEFQDVNPLQAEIIERVSRERVADGAKNLFVVGDVKQSIYRFRLAEPGLFLRREQAARTGGGNAELHAIALNKNFRSDAAVLHFVNALFERIMAPDLGGIAYDANARLVPATDAQQAATAPAVDLYLLEDRVGDSQRAEGGGEEPETSPGRRETDDEADATDNKTRGRAAGDVTAADWERIEREGWLIADRIRQLRRENPRLSYRDMVVLMRSPRRRAPLLARTLQKQGIPVYAELSGGFFDATETRDLLALLSVLDNARQDIPLATVLRSPLGVTALNDSQLAEIRVAAGRQAAFHEAVIAYAENGRDAALRDVLREALNRIASWRSAVRRRPLPEVLVDILRETGYEAYAAACPDGLQRLANINALHGYARRFATFRRQGLPRFLEFIEGLEREAEDLGAAPALPASADVVRIMSIHHSKGLEFPVVFVAELGKRFNFGDSRETVIFDRELGLGMHAVDARARVYYPTLPQRRVAHRVQREALAEELRILYVALTRAKHRLILVGTASANRVAQDRARFAGLPAPLPRSTRESAQSALDWIVPALASLSDDHVEWRDAPSEARTSARLCGVTKIAADAMTDWRLGTTYTAGVRERLAAFADLKRIDDGPFSGAPAAAPAESAIDDWLAGLTARYPHARLATLPAVVAASRLKRRFGADRDDEDPVAMLDGAGSDSTRRQSTQEVDVVGGPPRPAVNVFPTRLARPLFIARAGEAASDATTRGTWTHAFLEYVDLAGACDLAGLREQAEAMVQRGRLEVGARDAIDFDALAWFFATGLGGRLRAAAGKELREAPFVYRMSPAALNAAVRPAGPEDVVLVRGMIDCLFPIANGHVLIDYKTDHITPDVVPARRDLYAPQLRAYADAAEAIWRIRVTERYLVFLGPRQFVLLEETAAVP